MVVIHKYILDITDSQKIKIEGIISILSVAVQEENLVLYVSKEVGSSIQNMIEIIIRGTGNSSLHLTSDYVFLGTHIMKRSMKLTNVISKEQTEEMTWYTENGLVWHVWGVVK